MLQSFLANPALICGNGKIPVYPGHKKPSAHLAVASDIWYIFEKRNHDRKKEHEAGGKGQGGCNNQVRAAQDLLHVEKKAQLHQHSSA